METYVRETAATSSITHIRHLLLADTLLGQIRQRVREQRRVLMQHDITILQREEGPLDVRVQYRHANRLYEAVFTCAMLDAEAAGMTERWP